MSIQKIAQLAGVSVATISRVLSHSGTVEAENRGCVLQAIKGSNHQPSLLARQLRTTHGSMILMVVSNITNPFCVKIVKDTEGEAEKNGCCILLCNSGSDTARSRSALKFLSGEIVSGIITMDVFSKLPGLIMLIGDAPQVRYAGYAGKSTASYVRTSDVDAVQSVIFHLVDKDYRRVTLINHDLSYRHVRSYERGYKAALYTLLLEYQAAGYISELSSSAGVAAMRTLLAAEVRPDAVFAVSDMLTADVMRAIFNTGLQVLQSIAVVGFDGTELAEMVPPQLSTVERSLRNTGRKATGLLLNEVENPDVRTEKVMMGWRCTSRASI